MRRLLEGGPARQRKPRDEVGAVIGEVCPIIDQVLQPRPALAHSHLNQRQREDWGVDPERGNATFEPPAGITDPPEEWQVKKGEREQVCNEPEVGPRKAREMGEEGREKGQKTLLEGLSHRQARRNHLSESVLQPRRYVETRVVRIKPARQLEILDRRHEENAARDQ